MQPQAHGFQAVPVRELWPRVPAEGGLEASRGNTARDCYGQSNHSTGSVIVTLTMWSGYISSPVYLCYFVLINVQLPLQHQVCVVYAV